MKVLEYNDIKELAEFINNKVQQEAPDESINITVTEDTFSSYKNEIEKRTGVFHWKTIEGNYRPITELNLRELQTAFIHCEIQMDKLNSSIQEDIKKLEKQQKMLVAKIEQSFNDICRWKYKKDRIQDEANDRNTTVKSLPEVRAERKKDDSKDSSKRPSIVGD